MYTVRIVATANCSTITKNKSNLNAGLFALVLQKVIGIRTRYKQQDMAEPAITN